MRRSPIEAQAQHMMRAFRDTESAESTRPPTDLSDDPAQEDIDYRGGTTVELYPYETTAGGVARRAYEHLKPILPS